jgi:hypothetical protein
MPNGRCRMHGGMSPGAPNRRWTATKAMTEDYIDVYGGYAIKLLRLWLSPGVKRPNMSTEQTACDRPAGATDIRRSDWEPWVHSQGSLLFSGERPVTAAATVDGTRRGAVVESSVELTPSPHANYLRHYHGPVFPHAARSCGLGSDRPASE